MALSAITGVSNAEFWNLARKSNPNFKSHTAEATADYFNEKTFEALSRTEIGTINEYFELSMRVAFQLLNVSGAKNPFADLGLVETYATPNGGYTQRMAIDSIKPVSPGYLNLKDGDSPDPFVVRKPTVKERFFSQNFQYQSFISVQEHQVKTIFISETGMGAFLGGIMQGLENGYTIQEYVNTLEALHQALNSTKYALQDTQKLVLGSWTDNAPSESDLLGFIRTVKNLATQMEASAQTSAYNAMKFESVANPADMVMLVRTGVMTEIDLKVELGAFNPDRAAIPFAIKQVDNFGGLIPKGVNNEELQEVYDQFGAVKGYIDAAATINGHAFQNSAGQWLVNITSGGATADTTFPFEPDHWDDPNADVIAVIAQRGALFENTQNGYEVRPIYNPRGLYTNYWASKPNCAINVDPLYNMVVVTKPAI